MGKLVDIVQNPTAKKKFKAVFEIDGEEESVTFGARGYRDFTLVNDKNSKFYLPKMADRIKVRDQYLKRHAKNEDWDDPYSAGALSRWILWNKPTIEESLADYLERFNL